MLAGVGGRTVEEAQERMTYVEYIAWAEYAKKHGSFNLGVRIEDGFALLASVLAQLKGKRLTPDHFKPKREKIEEQQQPDIMAVFNMLKAKASETRAARVQPRRVKVKKGKQVT